MLYFIADFYFHKAKLVVEIDEDSHKYQMENDNGRTAPKSPEGDLCNFQFIFFTPFRDGANKENEIE